MAKDNNLPIWVIVGLLAYFVIGGQSTAPAPGIEAGVDLCSVVEPEASFTAVA